MAAVPKPISKSKHLVHETALSLLGRWVPPDEPHSDAERATERGTASVSTDRLEAIWGRSESPSASPSPDKTPALYHEPSVSARVGHEAPDLFGLWDPEAATQESRHERKAGGQASPSPSRPATAGARVRNATKQEKQGEHDGRGRDIRAQQLAEENRTSGPTPISIPIPIPILFEGETSSAPAC